VLSIDEVREDLGRHAIGVKNGIITATGNVGVEGAAMNRKGREGRKGS